MILRFLPLAAFPLTLMAVIGTYLALLAGETGLLASTYLSLSIAVAAVFFLEKIIPYRQEWKAGRVEQGQDLLFITLVHLLFTKFLAFAAAMLLATLLENGHFSFPWWPHHWPVLFQGMLMVLTVDFFRYWLHRACHSNKYLWRLHAVHHSPKRLYWLNVGRFHPAERTLQFLLDSVPFMLIGVGKEVLALYFLFFAVNGFFQHCNILLRYGVLNYVFSSAELHRWHHSKISAESNTNFSNTTIVWDMVFGTRFLPAGRSVGELGLTNDFYPTDFLSQMKTPLIAGIENRTTPLLSLRDILINWLLRGKMALMRMTLLRSLRRAAESPEKSQWDLLRGILRENRDTEFGKQHGFGEIRNEAEFRERVPVQSYEDLRPYIEEQEKSGRPMLTDRMPALFQLTSGTTEQPKYIPLVPAAITRANRLQKTYSVIQYDFRPEAFQGKLLGIVGPAIEGRLPSGIPFGSASGLIYRNFPRLVRGKYVLPYEIFEIEDYAIKYYLIMRLALAEKDITCMGSANPSTFFKLLEVAAEHREALLRDIRAGTAEPLSRLAPQIAKAIAPRLSPNPGRAGELERIFAANPSPSFGALWPHLKMIITWAGGSCGMAVAKLKAKLPAAAAVFELGYLSSEFRGSITVDGDTGLGVPTLQDHYFEFVGKEDWENGRPRFLSLAEAKPGEYYVFVTTPSGLYRYAMNDIVRIEGVFGQTPTLRFLQKGRGVTNITGEKLYESQVLEAVAKAGVGMEIHFFLMLADEEEFRYRLYLEARAQSRVDAEDVAGRIDSILQSVNVEYRDKRESGRLKPLQILPLKDGAGEAYKSHFLAKGRRETQFKPEALQYLKNLDMDLEPWRTAL